MFGVLGVTVALAPAGAHAQEDGLGSLADAIGFRLGVAVDAAALDDEDYVELVATDASMLSTIDDVAIGVVQPQPGQSDFGQADAIVELAEDRGLEVRGHILVGPDDLPPWVTGGQWTADTLGEVLRDHVTAVVSRYAERAPGVVTQWDVAGEAFLPDGTRRPTIWQQVIGDDWIRIAFDAAHAADPDAELYYSDFFDDLSLVDDAVASGVELTPGATADRTTCEEVPKCVAVQSMVAALVEQGVPIDGVGFQAHLFSPEPYDLGVFTDWVEPLGLRWAVTEFDVPVPATELAVPDTLAFQAEAYRAALGACLDDAVCDTFVMWGITDRVSPIPGETAGVFGGALPRDADGAPKPAYGAVSDVLRAAADAVAPTTSAPGTGDVDTAPAGTPTTVPDVASGDTDDGGDATGVVIAVAAAAVVVAVGIAVVVRRRRSDGT